MFQLDEEEKKCLNFTLNTIVYLWMLHWDIGSLDQVTVLFACFTNDPLACEIRYHYIY